MPPSAKAAPRKPKKASGRQKDAIDPITGGEQNVAWLVRRQQWIDTVCKYYGERLKPQSRALPIVPPANSDLLPGRLAPFDEKSFKERCASEGNKSSSSVTYGGNLLWIDPLCVSPSIPVMDARVKELKDYWKKRGNILSIDPLCVSPTVPVMDARVRDLKDHWKKPESPDIVFDISVSWSVNSEKPPYGKMTLVSPTEPLDQIAVGIATTIATATTR